MCARPGRPQSVDPRPGRVNSLLASGGWAALGLQCVHASVDRSQLTRGQVGSTHCWPAVDGLHRVWRAAPALGLQCVHASVDRSQLTRGQVGSTHCWPVTAGSHRAAPALWLQCVHGSVDLSRPGQFPPKRVGPNSSRRRESARTVPAEESRPEQFPPKRVGPNSSRAKRVGPNSSRAKRVGPKSHVQ
jgi:hypothetical protein